MAVEIYEDCNDTVAHLAGVKAAVRLKAEEGAARAETRLAAHKGRLGNAADRHSRITVTKGDLLDWFVNLEDPDGGAMSIEFGRVGTTGRGTSQGVRAITGAF